MLNLRVIKNTVFKQSTKPSETLSIVQKAIVTKNSEFRIKSYFKQDRHYFVRLDRAINPVGNSGFFFEDHVRVEEIRGVWLTNIDSNILDSKENIQREIQKLKSLKFNTIYPVVWNRGFTIYPSQITEKTIGWSVAEKFKGRDILAEIVEESKQHNLRVIPWFEYGLMTPERSPLAMEKKDWITQTSTGEKKQNENYWLNPCHPEVQTFFTELIADLVARYEIDGVQLDDHFGMPSKMGFDRFTRQLFQQETGGIDPIVNPNSALFKKWRIDKVSSLLQQIHTAVKSQKKDCIVSISPNPLNFSIENFLSDWRTWERKGTIEELVLQVYRSNLFSFKGELNKSEVRAIRDRIPTVIGIITGQKPNDKRVPFSRIEEQVKATRDRGFAGFSFFFFGSLFDLGFTNETPEMRTEAFARLLSGDRFYV